MSIVQKWGVPKPPPLKQRDMTRVEYSAVRAENDVLRAQNRLLRSQNRELYDRAEAMMKKAWKLVTTRGFESFEEFKAAIEEE